MKPLYKTIIYLMLILSVYTVLHVYHPNPENTTKNWAAFKDYFYDDNGKMYFLSYDSYYYVNNANMLISGRTNFESIDFDFQTLFLYVDKFIFGEYVLSYYLSFIVGILIIVLLFYLCYKFTNSAEVSLFATILFTVNDYFFANTIFNYVDNTIMNLLLFMLLFVVMVSELKYWQKWVIGIFVYWFLVLNWNGAFLFDFILILFLGLYIYYKKLDIQKYKREIIVAGCTVIFFGIMFYFSAYFDIILTYLSFESLGVAELKHFSFNLFYLVLFFFPLMYFFDNLFKENLEINNIILISFLIIFMAAGLWYLRLFVYCLPFIFITVAVFLTKIEKWYYLFILFALLVGLYYLIIPFSVYDGGQYGVPFVDDSVVKTGEWIKENTKEDIMIITMWDYGVFYENYAERTAKYKHSPVGTEVFYKWLYNKNADEAIVQFREIGCSYNCVIVVDEHWLYNSIRDAIKGKRAAYPDEDTIYYKMLNRQSIGNLTLLHEEYGGRLKFYYIYGVK